MGALSGAYYGVGYHIIQSGFIIFLDYRDILGGWIYTFTFLYLLTYIGVIYLNLFWLFPKFLLKRRYLTYISLLSVAMMLALAIQMATEYVSYSCWPEFYERASYFPCL